MMKEYRRYRLKDNRDDFNISRDTDGTKISLKTKPATTSGTSGPGKVRWG
jgi:hypothetical protein